MPFEWPSVSDIQYRLWRLRRLILVAALLPTLVFAIKNVLALLVFASPIANLLPFAGGAVLFVALHAVLFPNAMTETMTLSITAAIAVVVAPLAGNSVLGWLVLIVVAALVGVFAQGRLLQWQMDSTKTATVLTAAVQTRIDRAEAMAGFPPCPDRETSSDQSGSVNEAGYFPVFMTSMQPPLDSGLEGDMQAFVDAQAADYDPYAEDGFDAAEDALEVHPSYWACIVEQRDDYQKTVIHDGGPDGPSDKVQAVVEHRLTPTKSGWKMTETETVEDFEQGLGLGMWVSDFQMDGLIMRRDELERRPVRALRRQHHHSLLTLLGQAFMNRQISKQMSSFDDNS